MEQMIERIKVTDHIDLELYEGTDDIGGCYISIKHSIKMRDMEGEVIITPVDVPKLLQALASAAIKLTSRECYSIGFETAQEGDKNDPFIYIGGYHQTASGAEVLKQAGANRTKRLAEIRSMNLGKKE
jgi:hypothetical protein